MVTLAEHVEKAIRLFIKTARLDIGSVLGAFRDEPSAPARKAR
jgi:hypothetical protein